MRKETDGLAAEDVRLLLEGETRLVCVSMSDLFITKDLVITLMQIY